MGGLRLVVVAVALWLVWRLVRTALPGPDAAQRRVRGPERMEKCAFCEVHVPASETVHRGGRCFCGEAHADAYEREHGS
jgi:uncharacterized protein